MSEKRQFPSAMLDQYMLRFPDGMRARLKDAAAENKRSMNAEIIARLEASFETGSPLEESDSDLRAIRQSIEDLREAYRILSGNP
jgi:plasmid stability protein